MKDYEIILDEAIKGMGFVPNSLHRMSAKPNILGAFSILYANIKGFSSSKTTIWTGVKLFLKNLRWTLKAKRESHLEVPAYLKDLIANVASNAAGCRYCQAHTAHTAHKNGVALEKIQKIWEFQTSDLFSEQERVALNFAMADGSVPNQVTTEHHKKLAKFFTEPQIIEIVSTIAIFGFLNRWNDSMATELEDEPLLFGNKYLYKNWEPGKHQTK
ncbi:carboxymuconolactone decarboxylase family protein [Maribacter sp. IgM3_T14_3]|uniref:carboxymuconolactone decarboxylase family protein n=1 Tax=Maribacter sp. IgM3_T14_3 TaxID=3415140 RepID=UPI003C6F8EE0